MNTLKDSENDIFRAILKWVVILLAIGCGFFLFFYFDKKNQSNQAEPTGSGSTKTSQFPPSSSATTLIVKDDRLIEATVSDADGIKSIVGLQRIPNGDGYLNYSVDFMFEDVGAKKYDIYIGGMFDVVGTAVHVDVTDMKGETSYLFIMSTPEGYKRGVYEKQ